MFNIISFDKLDSTNTYAINNIAVLNDGDVIFAKEQTNGRGRMNRAWSSSSDCLTFTIVIKDKFIKDHFDCISIISAVSVYQAIQHIVPNASIKWPNDVYIGDKKTSGILLEGASSTNNGLDYLLVGIGVNVNIEQFDSPLSSKATSLYLETNQKFDKEVILNNILKYFYQLIDDLKVNKLTYLEIAKEHNYLKGKKAFAHFSSIEGEVEILDILPNNKLLVNYNNEQYELDTGEITFHKE